MSIDEIDEYLQLLNGNSKALQLENEKILVRLETTGNVYPSQTNYPVPVQSIHNCHPHDFEPTPYLVLINLTRDTKTRVNTTSTRNGRVIEVSTSDSCNNDSVQIEWRTIRCKKCGLFKPIEVELETFKQLVFKDPKAIPFFQMLTKCLE